MPVSNPIPNTTARKWANDLICNICSVTAAAASSCCRIHASMPLNAAGRLIDSFHSTSRLNMGVATK